MALPRSSAAAGGLLYGLIEARGKRAHARHAPPKTFNLPNERAADRTGHLERDAPLSSAVPDPDHHRKSGNP